MTSITTRAGKGSPLTHNEVDANFTNLNTDKLDTAGIALGSAASPTLKFTGDPNTGIYSPGADQLAVSTGGTERLFIDSSGRVGIGTSSPGTNLHVVGTSLFNGAQSVLCNSTTGSYMTFQHNGTSVGDIGTGSQVISGGATTDFALSPRSTGSLIFATSSTERLRIDSSGNVGIGTSTPRGLLSISNNATGTGVVDSSLHLGLSVFDNYGFRIVNSNDPTLLTAGLLKFQRGTGSNWTDSVVIDNSGNVGIGTSSPTTLLDVNADTVRVRTARTPASATATGATGEICWDANYIYVCTATNTWRRTAISSW